MATQAGKVNRAEAAGFSANVDLNHIKSGDTFQATWTFRNSGTKRWNGRYRRCRRINRAALGVQQIGRGDKAFLFQVAGHAF